MDSHLPDLIESRELVSMSLPDLSVLEERVLQSGAPRQSSIILALENPMAYYVTQQLENFDREFRRTAARARRGDLPLSEALSESLTVSRREEATSGWIVARDSMTTHERPRELRGSLHGVRPDAPQASSLRLVASEPGSSLLLLEAVGSAITVMASTPMTAILNAAAWSGPVRRVRAWLSRRGDPLDGVSARQALSVLSEFNGEPQQIFGRPDQEIDMGGPVVHMPGGMTVKGARRIHLVHRNADGSTTWIDVE